MNSSRNWVLCVLMLAMAACAFAQQYDEAQFKGMQWRSIGPYRGGRVLAVTGVVGNPFTYYFGGVSGGVWRTASLVSVGRFAPIHSLMPPLRAVAR